MSLIRWDDSNSTLEIFSAECCEQAMDDTGCDAPGCTGFACPECGGGCDREAAGDHGRCAQALAAEPEDERNARFDRERAAFGLPPVGGVGPVADAEPLPGN